MEFNFLKKFEKILKIDKFNGSIDFSLKKYNLKDNKFSTIIENSDFRCDLYETLKSGHLIAAGLDTQYEEPLKEDYKLAELDNVILTPHIGGLSYEAFENMMQEAMANIKAFEEGRFGEIEAKKLIF